MFTERVHRLTVYTLFEGTSEGLAALYNEEYFRGEEYADYVGDKRVTQKNLRKWLRVVRSYVEGGKLVEVGCAYGFFLELAREHFDVLGYDVSEEAVQYANDIIGVPARCRDFLSDDSLNQGSVDAIASWDVIEHLPEPDRFIRRCNEVLHPGGYLFLTTGDIDSWVARRQGKRWRLICPPIHTQYFSGRTIKHLLMRDGFETVKIFYPGYWRSLEQMLHGIFTSSSHHKPSAIYRVLRKITPKKIPIYLNTFDIMFVVARKK